MCIVIHNQHNRSRVFCLLSLSKQLIYSLLVISFGLKDICTLNPKMPYQLALVEIADVTGGGWFIRGHLLYVHVYMPFSCCHSDENIGMLSNITYKGLKETVKITNAALLEGDLESLEKLLYSNLTQVRQLKQHRL